MVNMIQIRNNVFETNSSSSHSFTIDRIVTNINDLKEDLQVMMDDKDIYYAEKLLDSLIDLIKEYEYKDW